VTALGKDDLATMKAAFKKKNLDACRNGIAACDPLQLSPAESAEVAQLSERRNLEHCVRFQTSCDPGILTSPEMALVSEASRQHQKAPRQ
jgi:hypothetical protein